MPKVIITPTDSKIWRRFRAKFVRGRTDECWEWTGRKTKGGYGQFRVSKTTYMSSRAAYIIYFGQITNSLSVCHKCDNPGCVNPNHLFLGTTGDNMRDKVNKNRQAKGESHGMRKLTEENIREIRLLRVTGLTQLQISLLFGVTKEMVGRILKGLNWKHVT